MPILFYLLQVIHGSNVKIFFRLDIKVDIARKNIFTIYNDKGYEYQEVFDEFLIKFHGKLDYKILASAIVAYRKTKEASIILYPNVNST